MMGQERGQPVRRIGWRIGRALGALALVIVVAGCASSSQSASPAASTAASPAASTAASPAASTAASPAASTAASPAASTAASPAASTAGSLAYLLPAAIKTSGVIQVASLDGLAPWSFKSGSDWQGVDVDLANAMGELLGVKFVFSNVDFPGQLPGLEAGRFDIIIDEIGDTVPREAIADFVDYSTDSTAIVVKKGNPENISGMADLCGKSVAYIPGTTPQQMIANYQTHCTSAGKSQINGVSVPGAADTYLAVSSGRVDATLNGYSTMAYTIQQGGAADALQIAPGPLFDAGVNGIAVAKGNGGLLNAVQASLNALIANGTYAQIMEHWGVSALSVKIATINDAKDFPANLGG